MSEGGGFNLGFIGQDFRWWLGQVADDSYWRDNIIPGNFSLHAGDTVFMDIPESGTTQNKACSDEVNKEDGGLYLITDLCHFITAKETYTKLVLTRDSFGRVGSPSPKE